MSGAERQRRWIVAHPGRGADVSAAKLRRDGNRPTDKLRAYHNARRRQLLEYTRELATAHRQPWDSDEDARLRDITRTDLDLALELGRTQGAVRHRRERLAIPKVDLMSKRRDDRWWSEATLASGAILIIDGR